MFSLTQYFKTTLFVLVSGVYFNLFKISTDFLVHQPAGDNGKGPFRTVY